MVIQEIGNIGSSKGNRYPLLMFDNQGNPSYIVKKESNKVIVCQTNNKFSFSLSLNYTTDNFYLSQYNSNTFVIGICNALSSELNIRIVNVYTQRITFENTTTKM